MASADDRPALPTKRDFCPHGTLDEKSAWNEFGGLTLAEADAKFRENPLGRNEAFMWMGGRAFAFYFPILEGFLRETPEPHEADERHAWILAQCIKMQFTNEDLADVVPLVPRIVDLANFVQANIRLFDPAPQTGAEVYAAWQELRELILKVSSL